MKKKEMHSMLQLQENRPIITNQSTKSVVRLQ